MFAILAVLSLTCVSGSEADEAQLRLIMVEESSCRFCRAWNADVGAAYPKSKEGALAPLVRVKHGAPETAAFAPVVYTPTFILARDDKEIGRITGYPGESFFWEELAVLLEKAEVAQGQSGPHAPAAGAPPRSQALETLAR